MSVSRIWTGTLGVNKIEVKFDWTPGSPATYTDPADSEEIDFSEVWLITEVEGKEVRTDIFSLIDALNGIENLGFKISDEMDRDDPREDSDEPEPEDDEG